MAVNDYDLILMHLVRSTELLEQARMVGLEAGDFNQSKLRHYGILWAIADRYFADNGKPVPKMIMDREVGEALANEEMLSDRLRNRVTALVELIYSVDEKELATDYVRDKLLQPMIDELKVLPRVRDMATETDVVRVTELFMENQRIFDQTRVVVNREADMFSAAGRQRHTEGKQPESTGIDFVDMAVGGLRPASMVGVMAESSGGKTMFGTQYLCEQGLGNNVTLGFFYEQSIEGDIAERFYSYLGNASRDEIRGRTHNEYPERVRKHLDAMEQKMKETLRIYDMSGSIQGQGNGGPDEIEAIIGQLVRKGVKVKSAVIDWLLPMVTKLYKMPKNVKVADTREKINLVLTRLKEITERWGVTIVVLTQIAPHAIESKTPQYKPDWTVSAECKSFGFLMDYVFAFGRKCDVTNCMWFNVPKARGSGKTCRVVMMDANYNKIMDARDYELNSMGDRDGKYFNQRRGKSLPKAGAL